jgi:uncharacterized short protein YbdD (DUF466 family)
MQYEINQYENEIKHMKEHFGNTIKMKDEQILTL